MDCKTFEADRVLKSSGETASAEFESHLVTCASCQSDVAEFREISRLYHESSTERLPASVAMRVRAQGDVRLRLQRGMRMVGALAAAVLVAVMMWSLLKPAVPAVKAPVPEAAALTWEPLTPSGEYLIVLTLDDRLRAARARADVVTEQASAVDESINALKKRIGAVQVDRDRM